MAARYPSILLYSNNRKEEEINNNNNNKSTLLLSISLQGNFAQIFPSNFYLQILCQNSNTWSYLPAQVKSGIWFYLTYKLWNFPVTISWMLTETKDSWVFINHYPAYLYRLPWPLGPMGMMPWAWMTACTCNGLHYWRRAPSFEKHNIL